MDDAVIDTNVLIVASLVQDPQAADTHRSLQDCRRAFEWLDSFRQAAAVVVLDDGYHIHGEYLNKLNASHFGMMVIDEKLRNFQCRMHSIEHEREIDRAAVVPEAFADLDRSDRKFLAVALADRDAGHHSAIVNATDTDGGFWSTARRDALLTELNAVPIPRLFRGRTTLRALVELLEQSQSQVGPTLEGLYVRRESSDRLLARAKLVRREFLQQIDEHWSRQPLRTNSLASG